MGEWWREGVVYQIYPRSFADSDGDGVGDLAGITARLGYLAKLGVQAVWISPFQRSPQADHGYDISDYCDVDPPFGDPAHVRGDAARRARSPAAGNCRSCSESLPQCSPTVPGSAGGSAGHAGYPDTTAWLRR